jgi:hypothetical protein
VTVYAQGMSERIYLPALSDSRPGITPTATRTATPTREPTETPEPTLTPTATATATPEPAQLVINGGFETGRNPWVFNGANRNQGGAYAGEWYASLASVLGAAIFQGVTVPLERPYLVFYQQRLSASTSCNVTAAVRVNSTNVATYGGFCQASQEGAWTRTVVDLRPYAGQQVTLRFAIPQEFNSDPDDPALSSWRIDNVGFAAAP